VSNISIGDIVSLFGNIGVPEPRTKKELAICKKIIRFSLALEEDPRPDEGYRRAKERRDALYIDLDKICKGDKNRYDENMIYIKAMVGDWRYAHRPKKTSVGGHINTPVGGGGLGAERDDRPNQ
jgi:hypothetical protein